AARLLRYRVAVIGGISPIAPPMRGLKVGPAQALCASARHEAHASEHHSMYLRPIRPLLFLGIEPLTSIKPIGRARPSQSAPARSSAMKVPETAWPLIGVVRTINGTSVCV